jgi:hypothetical protein
LNIINTGKSCFLFYVLLCRLRSAKSTALQSSPDHFFLFDQNGVTIYDVRVAGVDVFSKGANTWALTDSSDNLAMPCAPFLAAATADLAWVVQATSPKQSRYKAWTKHRHGFKYVMRGFTPDEFISLGLVPSTYWGVFIFTRILPIARYLILMARSFADFPRNGARQRVYASTYSTPKCLTSTSNA